MMKLYKLGFFLIIFICTFHAQSQTLRAIFINPPNGSPVSGTDNGLEYIEIQGTPNQSLNNLCIIVIEGDDNTTVGNRGRIDNIISLSGQSVGSNGIHLRRDAATAMTPAPSTGTNVSVGDFSPDLENGTSTFVLVNNCSMAMVGQDLDTNDDGVLDVTPWTSVLDVVGVNDGGAGNVTYTTAASGTINGTTLPPLTVSSSTDAKVIFKEGGIWYAADVSGDVRGGLYTIIAGKAWNASGVANTALNGRRLHPGGASSPLPVVVSYFQTTVLANKISVDWGTEEEINSDFFEVQRSSDLAEFIPLGRINAAGESKGKTIRYNFMDTAPLAGTAYYRLKQVDKDGSFEFSRVVSAILDDNTLTFEILGNPAQNQMVRVLLKNFGVESLRLYNLAGQELPVALAKENDNEFALTPKQPLAAGMYILMAKEGNITATRKLVIR